MSESAAFGAALAHVQQRVERACARAGRDPAAVRLLPVSKAVRVERLRAALELGLTTFGENRVQEAAAKAAALPAARWELIGHLQSNKAARAVALFDVIHSVDSVELARRLDRLAGETGRPDRLSVYLEINVDADPAKTGFDPPTIEAGLTELASLDQLELRGLMTVGRLVGAAEEARPTFAALRRLSERLRGVESRLGEGLSMGMSADFEAAIEEGATVVRVGSALFGARPT
jgi:pyridoxal phosphate enzyme (YggS family)